MNKNKLRLLAASVAAFTVVAGIAAFFTGEDAVTNAFQASTLSIKITEPSWDPEPTIVPEQEVDKDPYITNTDKTPAYVFMEVTVPAVEVTVEKASPDLDKGSEAVTDIVPLFRFVNSEEEYVTDPDSPDQKINKGWYPMPGYPVANKEKGSEDDSIDEALKKTVSYTYLYAYTGADDNTTDTMAVLSPDKTTEVSLFNKVRFVNAREDEELSGSRQLIEIKAYGIQTEHLSSFGVTETKAERIWALLGE
ncbi:MAG: hypothetical protein IJ561_05730 [Ruminococcus sp.]|nr:hypothetical protein [Ruminococcus sp.]